MNNSLIENSIPMLEEDQQSNDIRIVVSKYVYHWPVFVFGLLVCLILSFLYLRYSTPVYSIKSTLLVKDDNKGAMPGKDDLLSEIDLFGSSKVVDNEIEILKSKTLMRKVVDRLNLTVSFIAEGRLKTSDFYKSRPVDIRVIRMSDAWYGKTLNLSFGADSTYQIEHKESGNKITGKLNQIQRNVFGIFKITPKSNVKGLVNSALTIRINDPYVLADNLLENLTVSLSSKQSSVLVLNYLGSIPELGQEILNTLIQVYNEEALTDKNKTTQSTIRFIDERLMLITGELTEVERDVEGFKSSRGLTDISNDANLFLESVKANDEKLNQLNLQLSVIKDIKKYLTSTSINEKLPSTLGIEDPVLLSQITQLGELQLQRDRLLETTTENNPLLAPLNRQITTTRDAVKNSIDNIEQALMVSKADLHANSLKFQSSIKKIPGQERQLISIKRQQAIKESLYLYLLQKKEEAAISYASSVADSRIVDQAYFSKVPVKPRKETVYLAGILFGLLLPFGYIYIRETLNDKVESEVNLAMLTKTPIVAGIQLDKQENTIVVQANSRTAIAEQFRALRTNMQYIHGSAKQSLGKITLFTSGMSGEGKTFVAINLATALALSGKKTVLLELDLRKPKVSRYLQLDNINGLSNYLIGKSDVQAIIGKSRVVDNFDVIGSGPIPPNPSELLIQPELEALLNNLKQEYDEIIIDSPPIGLVTDAQILAKHADVTLYIVRQGVTFKEQIKIVDQLHRNKKFPKLNIILNGISSGSRYGNSYGYGYGYYSDDYQEKKLTLKMIFKSLLERF